MKDAEFVLNLYPVYKTICRYLHDYEKCCFSLAIYAKYNVKFCFKTGKQNCFHFKPKDFQNLNLYSVDLYSLNWDACCRHRIFTNDEILHFFKFIPLKQLERWRKISNIEKEIFTLFSIK